MASVNRKLYPATLAMLAAPDLYADPLDEEPEELEEEEDEVDATVDVPSGLFPWACFPRYQHPISVSFPAWFNMEVYGPTLETDERKAPK